MVSRATPTEYFGTQANNDNIPFFALLAFLGLMAVVVVAVVVTRK